jgi:hypothetical protein
MNAPIRRESAGRLSPGWAGVYNERRPVLLCLPGGAAMLKGRRLLRIGALVLALIAALAAWAAVRWHVAGRVSDPGPLPPPVTMPEDLSLPFVPPEELTYEFGWNGVSAASLVVRTAERDEPPPPELVMSFRVATLPLFRRLWDFEGEGQTLVDPATLRPGSSQVRKRSGQKKETITTQFDWRAGVLRVHKLKESGDKVKERSFRTKVGLDIPAAFLVMRCQAGQAKVRNLRVVNGDSAFEVVLNPVGADQVQVRAGSFPATLYEVTVREMEAEEGAEPVEPETGNGKYRAVRLWVERETGMPVKLEAAVFVGSIHAELVKVVRGEAVGTAAGEAPAASSP